jgi:SAM-dependent methyltransferase
MAALPSPAYTALRGRTPALDPMKASPEAPRMPASATKRPDYGLDAPLVIIIQSVVSAAAFSAAAFLYLVGVPHPGKVPLAEFGVLLGLNCLLNALGMVWYSKSGKLRQRDRLLDCVPWRGDEAVLDVGCGRGLMLIGAARRLTGGKAVGIDVWRAVDLTANRPQATLENAELEGVARRVEVLDGDARHLPFADGSFDVVLSSLALHNIADAEERRRAVREVARVLRPGGRVALLDIQHTRDYARVLTECGLADVRRSAAGPLFTLVFTLLTWGAVRFYRVTATKPATPPG